MRTTATLVVKGASYYEASQRIRDNTLRVGSSVILEPEPENPYDPCAVAVLIRINRAKIGHIARNTANKYFALARKGKVLDAKVVALNENDIKISVGYESNDDEALANGCAWLPQSAAVYAIRRKSTGVLYIGSSHNVRSRIITHFKDLRDHKHHNRLLQAEFEICGRPGFDVAVLAHWSTIAQADLLERERSEIEKHRRAERLLYNLTFDGQGAPPRYPPISSAKVGADFSKPKVSPSVSQLQGETLRQEPHRRSSLGIFVCVMIFLGALAVIFH